MIFTISTPDEFYFNQLLVFLTSLKMNSSSQAFIRLVDYPLDMETMLKRKFSNYIFENGPAPRIDTRGIGFILLRIELMKNWVQAGRIASWIDTDVVVRGDLSQFESVAPGQLKILYRGDHKPDKVKFNAGVFSIHGSYYMNSFMDRWYERLSNNAIWGQGQLEMWNTYKEFEDKIELVKMDEKYNDLGGNDRPNAFADSSIIWHCKAGHFNHPKFQKEFQYYLKIGMEKYNG